MRSIYFDYNATTPLDPEVREAMMPFLDEVWGNPSSFHHVGQKARACLDDTRDRAAAFLCCKPSELIFTSGGTESVNLAIFGAARLLKPRGRHLITSAIEHSSVLHSMEHLAEKEGFTLSILPVDGEGFVLVETLKKTIGPDTILVSIMAANNEIGTIQPVADLGAVCRERGILFHTDAVQWFGKEHFDSIHQFNADLVSICGHKFHGPKGSGALFIRSPLHPDPILFGGSHEYERRAGTENLAGIVGFVEALTRFVRPAIFSYSKLNPLMAKLVAILKTMDGVTLLGPEQKRLVNTIAFVAEHTDSVALLAGLDIEGICASSGSACSSGSVKPSRVVTALGLDPLLANSLIRFSLGRESSSEQVQTAERVLPEVIRRVQRHQQSA